MTAELGRRGGCGRQADAGKSERAQPQKCSGGTADEALAAAVEVGGRIGCSAGATVLTWSRERAGRGGQGRERGVGGRGRRVEGSRRGWVGYRKN